MTGNYGEHDVDVNLGKSHLSFTQCSLKTTQIMPMLMKKELDVNLTLLNVKFDNDGRESNYNVVFCKKGLIQEQKDFSFSQKSYHLFVSS